METMSTNVQQMSSYIHDRELVLTAFQRWKLCNVSAWKTAPTNRCDSLQVAHIKQAGDSDKTAYLQYKLH